MARERHTLRLRGGAGFDSLPPEIVLRIIRLFLDPRSIVRLGATNSILHELARSEIVWREIVSDLVNRHGLGLGHGIRANLDDAKFLLPQARHLGYFASSIPFTSRIVRVAVVPNEDDNGYSIRAAHVVARNAYSIESPPRRVSDFAHGATLEMTLDAYQISRDVNPDHPDAGVSIDVLEPDYSDTADMFDMTPAAASASSSPVVVVSSRHRGGAKLRLALEPVERTIHTRRRRRQQQPEGRDARAFPNERESQLSREALLALFSGRMPTRPWPTLRLVGLDRQDEEDDNDEEDWEPSTRSRSIAFRGLEDWITARGASNPVARIERLAVAGSKHRRSLGLYQSDREDQAASRPVVVAGFRLRAAAAAATTTANGRTGSSSLPTPPPPPRPPVATTRQDDETGTATTRRRGVGRDGGMAVLWQGTGERDPDSDRPPFTILRAGDQDRGGFVLRIGAEREDPLRGGEREPTLTTTNGVDDRSGQARGDSRTNFRRDTTDHMDDRRSESEPEENDDDDDEGEVFFPIQAPAKRFLDPTNVLSDDPTCVAQGAEITAESLEGIWVGTYGSHGLEFVHLAVSHTTFPRHDSNHDPSSSSGGGHDHHPPTPPSREDQRGASARSPLPSSSSSSTVVKRIVTATKLTGDTNVPSGETTWIAFLDDDNDDDVEDDDDGNNNTYDADGNLDDHNTARADRRRRLDLSGSIPTISRDKWLRMNRSDPNQQRRGTMASSFSANEWNEGTTDGVGQIALSGFLQPGWTRARVRFIRATTTVRVDRKTGAKRLVRVVEEEGKSALVVAEGENNDDDRGRDKDDKYVEQVIESVEEIQLRWTELNKIAVFKRVRI